MNIEYYQSRRWQKKRVRILKRDRYMCQYSKRFGKQIEANTVHHIYPVEDYPEYAWCDWNLVGLSAKIHNAMHDRNTGKLTKMGIELMERTKI